jgi:hypothetical protein
MESDASPSSTSDSNNEDVESGNLDVAAGHSRAIPMQEINLASESEREIKPKTKSQRGSTGFSPSTFPESSGLRKSLSTSNIPLIVVHRASGSREDDSIFPL